MAHSIKAGAVSVVSMAISQLTQNILKIKWKQEWKEEKEEAKYKKSVLMRLAITMVREATGLLIVINWKIWESKKGSKENGQLSVQLLMNLK